MFEIFAHFSLSAESIVQSGHVLGILIIAAIVFAESGLLVGFFLPGDTLLFGAGLYASQGQVSLAWLLIAVIVAAVIGDNVGYSIGRRMGHRIFKKQDGLLFKHEYIERAEAFYEKHGGKTIIIARFTPIIRTFAPVVAGVGKMPRRRFFGYNLIGATLWGAGMILLGYFVGSRIPRLDKYIELVMIGVVVLSVGIAFGHVLKEAKNRRIIVARTKLIVRNIFLNKKVD